MIKKILTAIWAVILSVLFSGCSTVTAKPEPILKIGIISDTHCYDTLDDWGVSNLEKALKLFASKNTEMLLMAGDLANYGDYPETFTLYRKLCSKYFPQQSPIQIICAGNHDLYVRNNNDIAGLFKRFCDKLDIPHRNPYHTVIKGYDFITLSEDLNCKYTPELIGKLAKELEIAAKRDPQKPIFVITHYPPQDTITGSQGRSGKAELRKLFNKYPQVISISGHKHSPLEDERSIWQKEFTAINASTLNYGCIEGDFFNTCNGILPFGREAVQALYMEVYADNIVIRRYNVEDSCEIKPGKAWNFALPYDPANPKYSIAGRSAKSTPPAFPENAGLLLRYDYGFVYAVFDAAKHEDMVKYYAVEVARKDKNGIYQTTGSVKFIADFYRSNVIATYLHSKRMFFKLPDDLLQAGKWHKISVYAVETFGKASKPLVIERLIPHEWGFRKVDPKAMPQE